MIFWGAEGDRRKKKIENLPRPNYFYHTLHTTHITFEISTVIKKEHNSTNNNTQDSDLYDLPFPLTYIIYKSILQFILFQVLFIYLFHSVFHSFLHLYSYFIFVLLLQVFQLLLSNSTIKLLNRHVIPLLTPPFASRKCLNHLLLLLY